MTLHTIGYEGFSLDTFIQCLQDNRIQHLIDVRETPISRKKGFSKTALSNALGAAHIQYTHLKPLGCPKPVRDALKAGGSWQTYVTHFSQHLSQQTPTLQQLVELAAAESVVLLCYEADHQRCHRSLVACAAASLDSNIDILHISAKTTIAEPLLQQVA